MRLSLKQTKGDTSRRRSDTATAATAAATAAAATAAAAADSKCFYGGVCRCRRIVGSGILILSHPAVSKPGGNISTSRRNM